MRYLAAGFSLVGKRRARGNDLWLFPILQTHCADDTNIGLKAPISLHFQVTSIIQRGRAGRKSMIKVSNDLVVPVVEIDDRRRIRNLAELSVDIELLCVGPQH